MYEASININSNNKHYLDYIASQLKGTLSASNGVAVVLNNEDISYLSIACQDNYKDKIDSVIKDCVADILSIGYKQQYLREFLHLSRDSLIANTLINTMSIFDSNVDRKQIINSITSLNKLSIDGIYNFKIKAIKKRWQEIISLTGNNPLLFSDDNVMIEFLSYLLEAIPNIAETLRLYLSKTKFEMSDNKGKRFAKIPIFNCNSLEEEILFNLIGFNPSKLIIDNQVTQLSPQFLQVINTVFNIEYEN